MSEVPPITAYCRPCGEQAIYATRRVPVRRVGENPRTGSLAFMLNPQRGTGAWQLESDGRYRESKGSTTGHRLHKCPPKTMAVYWSSGREAHTSQPR